MSFENKQGALYAARQEMRRLADLLDTLGVVIVEPSVNSMTEVIHIVENIHEIPESWWDELLPQIDEAGTAPGLSDLQVALFQQVEGVIQTIRVILRLVKDLPDGPRPDPFPRFR